MQSDYQWQKRQKLGLQKNIVEPLLEALKKAAEVERDELIHKLENLKRLGVISMSKAELNKKLEEMKFKT